MKAGVIVKSSQNVLIGVAAFVLALWWAVRTRDAGAERPSVRIVWESFPKFVLGFLLASCGDALAGLGRSGSDTNPRMGLEGSRGAA